MKSKKLALSVFVTASLAAATAYAGLLGYYSEIIYYSDASHTKVVGEETITCMGNSYVSGVRSNYPVYEIHVSCRNTPTEP